MNTKSLIDYIRHASYPICMMTISRLARVASPFYHSCKRMVHNGSKKGNPIPFSILSHRFDFAEASKRFIEHDKKRLFSPTLPEQKPGLVIKDHVPLRKVFLPFFLFQAVTKPTNYNGQYGRGRTYLVPDGKGGSTTYHTVDWYHTSGHVGSYRFNSHQDGMQIYAGYRYNASVAEQALGLFDIPNRAWSSDDDLLDDDVDVDPFLKRSVIAKEQVIDHVRSCIRSAIHSDIQNRHWTYHSRVDSFNLNFEEINMRSCLLPAYVLQYKDGPARIMPAVDNSIRIKGAAPLSVVKVSVAGTVATAALSILFPASIPARFALISAGSFASALWAKYRLSLSYSWNQRRIRRDQEHNETVSETINDRHRREATEKYTKTKNATANIGQMLKEIDLIHFEVLGLDPKQPVTREIVNQAFRKKIISSHPDHAGHAGHNQQAREIITARNCFIKAFQQKRQFSSRVTIAVKEPPRSVFDPNARKLIDCVLRDKNYSKALRMVTQEEVHPDSHDQGENTLLSEAAKRGDVEAIDFAIEILHASPDTSCDCPAHRTPLHYAAQNGDNRAVQLLLEKGATVNLINSMGETALDVAISHNHSETARLLKENGAIQHRVGLIKRIRSGLFPFIGWSPKDRTKLIENKRVFYLPPPKKEDTKD